MTGMYVLAVMAPAGAAAGAVVAAGLAAAAGAAVGGAGAAAGAQAPTMTARATLEAADQRWNACIDLVPFQGAPPSPRQGADDSANTTPIIYGASSARAAQCELL